MESGYRDEINAVLEELPDDNLQALLNALRRLRRDRAIRRWSAAIGTLTEPEAAEMQRVIEEGCETIDPDSW